MRTCAVHTKPYHSTLHRVESLCENDETMNASGTKSGRTSIEVLDEPQEFFSVLIFGYCFRVDFSLFNQPSVEFGSFREQTTTACQLYGYKHGHDDFAGLLRLREDPIFSPLWNCGTGSVLFLSKTTTSNSAIGKRHCGMYRYTPSFPSSLSSAPFSPDFCYYAYYVCPSSVCDVYGPEM